MEILLQDLRYALRVFRKNPGFTIVAILTLAVGIGANTAIFSITNALFVRPLPVRNPEQVVRVLNQAEGTSTDTFSFPLYREMRDGLRGLEVSAHQHTPVSFGTGKKASTIHAEVVSGNFFRVYDIQPVTGRALSEADDRAIGAHPVAMISHRLWKNSFQQNPSVIGQPIYLNGHLFTVAGVLPEGFSGSYITSDTDVWTTISMHEQIRPRGIALERPGWGWLNMTARLHEGVSLQEAETEIAAIEKNLKRDLPGTVDGVTLRITPATALPESLSGGLARALRFLSVVAALALLVVCANLAGALLSHMLARSRETAIRHSIGASRSRLLRQWLTETVLLALLGGVAGLLLSIWCKEGLKLLLPNEWQPMISTLNLDFRVLLFAFLASLTTGILCGMIPALQLRNPDTNASIKGSAAGGAQRHRVFGAFVAAQTSISLLLLIIATLLLRSLLTSAQFDVGFNPKNLLVATIDTQRHGFTEDQGRDFFLLAADRLRSLPQVLSLSYATVTPLEPNSEVQGFEIPGHTRPDGKRIFSIDYNSVGTEYFRTMQIPLLRGRDFTKQDVQSTASPVAIINQTMAKMFWPEKNAVGQRIRLAGGPELEIVGVARDIQYYSIGEEPRPYVYLTPNVVFVGQMTFQIRTSTEPEKIAQTVIHEIAAVDPNLAPYNVMSCSQLRKLQMFPLRALTTISILLGIVTLVLTSVGIYGVLSYAVLQRTKEIGVRMALGATRRMILAQTLKQGLMFVFIGTATGMIASLFMTRFLSSILFQISPTDKISFIAVTILISAVATIAALIPARRAMKIEPTIALRYE